MDTSCSDSYYERSISPRQSGVAMDTPEPRTNRSEDTTTWSPPLPAADGFDHLVVETPGLRTHVAVVGEGDPVVLLHGFPQHWWQWRAVAPAIAAAGYRVYLPRLARGRLDRRGRSRRSSAKPGSTTSSRSTTPSSLERAHLVSHDMGVITAIQLTYDHPERVRAAVQLSVPPFFISFSPSPIPGFRHLPAVHLAPSGSIIGRDVLRGVRRPAAVKGHHRDPPGPSAGPRSTPRCVRWCRGMVLRRPGAWRGAPTVAGG